MEMEREREFLVSLFIFIPSPISLPFRMNKNVLFHTR